MNEKQLKLLSVLTGVFLGTAILLLIVDYQLKNAVIEEANKLRRIIRYGQGNEGSDSLRNSSDVYWNGPFPSDMVVGRNAGMETESPYKASNAASDSEGQPNGTAKDGNP